MSEFMHVKFRRKVSLVVLPLDGLTDAPISLAAVTITPAYAKGIRKSEGYVVFTDLPDEPLVVTADAPGYDPLSLPVSLSQLGDDEPVLRLRLAPKIANEAAWITGRVTAKDMPCPGAHITLRSENPVRLMEDAPKDAQSISLFEPGGKDPCGSLWEMEQSGKSILIRLGRRLEPNQYAVSPPLPQEFMRSKTRLTRLYETYSGQNGTFRYPMALSQPQSISIAITHPAGKATLTPELAPGTTADLGEISLSRQ